MHLLCMRMVPQQEGRSLKARGHDRLHGVTHGRYFVLIDLSQFRAAETQEEILVAGVPLAVQGMCSSQNSVVDRPESSKC